MTDQRRATNDPDRRPRLLVIGLLAVIFSGVLSALAPAAFAHNALVSSNPAAGSVMPQAPTSIELVFDQDVKDFSPGSRSPSPGTIRSRSSRPSTGPP